MRKATFHEDAFTEMNEAAQYYEERSSGLGLSFLDAVEEAVEKILENPKAYQIMGNEVRHKLLRRFPYSVLYVVGQNRIRVMAIAHQKRRPGYWHYRL